MGQQPRPRHACLRLDSLHEAPCSASAWLGTCPEGPPRARACMPAAKQSMVASLAQPNTCKTNGGDAPCGAPPPPDPLLAPTWAPGQPAASWPHALSPHCCPWLPLAADYERALAMDEAHLERLMAEAAVMANLRHPNIVTFMWVPFIILDLLSFSDFLEGGYGAQDDMSLLVGAEGTAGTAWPQLCVPIAALAQL